MNVLFCGIHLSRHLCNKWKGSLDYVLPTPTWHIHRQIRQIFIECAKRTGSGKNLDYGYRHGTGTWIGRPAWRLPLSNISYLFHSSRSLVALYERRTDLEKSEGAQPAAGSRQVAGRLFPGPFFTFGVSPKVKS
jgi:hypothetical protein